MTLVPNGTAASAAPPPPRVWTTLASTISMLVAASLPAFAVVVANHPGWRDSPQALRAATQLTFMEPRTFVQTLWVVEPFYGLLPFAAAFLGAQPWRERLGLLRPVLPWRSLAWVAPAAIAVAALGAASEELARAWFQPFSASVLGGRAFEWLLHGPRGPMIAALLGASIAPGVCEELLFRGWLQTRLLGRWRPVWAIGVTSGLFAMAHGPIRAWSVFPLAVLLGWIAWRAGSIVPGMCVHALVNLTFMGIGALALVITRGRGLTHMQGVAVLLGLAVASLLATIAGRQRLATAPPA